MTRYLLATIMFSCFQLGATAHASPASTSSAMSCQKSYSLKYQVISLQHEKQTLQDLARLFIDWQSQEPGSGKWLSLKDKYEQVRDQIQWTPENSKYFYDTVQALNGKLLQAETAKIEKTEKQKKEMYTKIEQSKQLNEFLKKYDLKDLNDSDTSRYTALHYAARSGHKDIVELLLKDPRFTAINSANNYGWTALHWTAQSGHKDIVEILLKEPRFTAINTADIFSGDTALHEAAQKGHKDIVELLLKDPRFTAINSANKNGNTALHYAALTGRKYIVELLLKDPRFTAINSANKNGNTALHWAAKEGHKDIAELLKKYGATE